MFNLPQSTFGRRSFLRFSALSVAAGSFLMNPISKAVAQAVKEIEPFYWNACVINCGQRCPQRCFVKGGQVIRVETDNTAGDACDHRQIRACLRGRALRQRLYSPDRLKYPMKRVGERGKANSNALLGMKPSKPWQTTSREPLKNTAMNPSIGSIAPASSL